LARSVYDVDVDTTTATAIVDCFDQRTRLFSGRSSFFVPHSFEHRRRHNHNCVSQNQFNHFCVGAQQFAPRALMTRRVRVQLVVARPATAAFDAGIAYCVYVW
jgi:hypothetical protein